MKWRERGINGRGREGGRWGVREGKERREGQKREGVRETE